MSNENEINLKITTTTDTNEVKKLSTEVKQLGENAEKASKKTIEGQKEELGLLGKLEKQLKDLKETRSKANSEEDIERLNKEILEAEKNLKKLNNLGVKDELAGIKDETKSFSDQLEGLPGPAGEATGAIKSLGAAANPATLIVAALAAAIVATFTASKESAFGLAEETKAIQNLKNVTGVATLTAVAFSQAAKTQGVDASDLVDIFNQVAGAVSEVKAGNKDLADSFKRLGIEDLSNLDNVVKQLATNFSTLPKDIQTVSDFSKLLGEEGVKQVGLFASEIPNATEKVKEYGLANEETIKKGLDLNKALNDNVLAFQALQNTIGGETSPAFTQITKDISAFIVELSKSEQAKKFFRDFADGLLEIVKFAVSSKEALKDLTATIDPFIQRLGIANNTLELLYKGTLPSTISFLAELGNTFVLGHRALDQQIKKQQEYEANLKQVSETSVAASNQQLKALGELKAQIDRLTEANQQLLDKEKVVAESRIQNIQNLIAEGTTKEKDGAIEVGQIKQDLANLEIKLAKENRDKIAELAQQSTDLKEELADAEIALSQAILAAERQRTETTKQLQQIAFAEEKERIEELRKDRQSANTQELADIKELEDKKTILHEDAAKKRREITLRELQAQIDEETNLSNNSDIGEKQREEARKRLSDLIRKQAETDRQTEKEIQDAILKDVQEADKAKIASNKAVSDAAKAEADKQKALADQQKTLDKVAFDVKIAALKASGATAEQIALETANFEIQQQQKIIDAIRIKIQVQQAANTGNKEISAELIKLDTELIAAQGKLNQLTADRNGILEKTKNVIKEIKTEGSQGNDAFVKSVEASAKSVEKLGERVNSAVDAIGRGGIRIGESFDIASQSVEELQTRIEELNNSANFIEAFFAGPGKQEAVIDIRNAVDKLNEELINKTQRVALEAAQQQAAEELRIQQEKQQELIEINQERIEKLTELEQDYAEDIKDLNEDRNKENDDFLKASADRLAKYNSDRIKLEEEFALREKEVKDKAAQDEIERIKSLERAKTEALNQAEKERNQSTIKNLVDEANLIKQINAENDPKKKAELQKQLSDLTTKNGEKEKQEKEKQAEIQKALESSTSKEEFEAKKKAIEEKFDLLENEQEQRQAIIDSGDKARLAKFDEFIKKEKERIATQLAQTLEGIKQEQLLRAKQLEEEKAQRAKDFADKQKERKDQFDSEQAEAEKEHKDRLSAIDAQQKEIRAKYKETFTEINQQAIDSAKQIGATGEAIANAFALGNKELEKYIANLNKASQAQAGLNPGSSATPSSSSPSTTSSSIGNSSSPTSASSSSPTSSPSNNNSGTGSIGSPTAPPPSPSGKQTTTTAGSQGNQQSGVQKEKAGQQPSAGNASVNVPSEIKTSSEYSKIAFEIFDKFEKIRGNRGISEITNSQESNKLTELFNKLSNANFSYIKAAGLNTEETRAIATSLPYLFNAKNPDKNRKFFTDQVNTTIKYVEANRKTKGKDKGADVGGDIGTKDTPVIDTSGSSGGTKGDVADTGNQSGSVAPPPEAPKDTRFDPKKENVGEGAEAEGFQFGGPNFPTGQQPNSPAAPASQPPANVSVPIQQAIGSLTINVQASEEMINSQIIKLLQDANIGKMVTNAVNGNNSNDNFSRNPGKRIAF